MDFLIGGLPRGGTTITADLFNYHPDAYCLAQESQVLPICMRLADSAPVAPDKVEAVRAVITRDINHVLHDMAAHNVAKNPGANVAATASAGVKTGGLPQRLIFDEARVKRFSDKLGDMLEAGLYGKDLLVRSLAVLETEIRKDVGARFIGEKSPANIFAISRFGLLGSRVAVIMKREPFAFMKSMRQLAGAVDSRFAGAFRKSVWEMIGMYGEYAASIAALTPSPSLIVADYVDLIAAPTTMAARMFDAAGLPKNAEAAERAAAAVRPPSGRPSWEAFNPDERALIWRLTAQSRKSVGHTQGYYETRGMASEPYGGNYAVTANMAHNVAGFEPAGGPGNLWLGECGQLALETKPECKRVILSFWASFPEAIVPAGKSATIDIFAGVQESKVASVEILGGAARNVSVSVNLLDMPPDLQSASGAVRLLKLRSSHSHKPVSLPASITGQGKIGASLRSAILRPLVFE